MECFHTALISYGCICWPWPNASQNTAGGTPSVYECLPHLAPLLNYTSPYHTLFMTILFYTKLINNHYTS